MTPRWLLVIVALVVALGGCASRDRVSEPPPAPAPPTVKRQPAPPVPVVKKQKEEPAAPEVVILISEAIPPYTKVAKELLQQLPQEPTVLYLNHGGQVDEELNDILKQSKYQQIVAVGLKAAMEAKRLAGMEDEVIFCQVFNYQDYRLTGPRSKGVGAVPGTRSLFASWRKMSPELKQVVVITGSGMEEVVMSAEAVAAEHGVVLRHQVVNNDKELLFEYKRMAPQIQGLWLLPDNRVLSGNAIRELLMFSVRNGKQVAVFSDELLRLGGLLSVSARPSEIAEKVIQRLQGARGEAGVPGPELLLLEDGDIQVNHIVARRFGIDK